MITCIASQVKMFFFVGLYPSTKESFLLFSPIHRSVRSNSLHLNSSRSYFPLGLHHRHRLYVLSATVEPLLYDHPQNHIGVVV